MDKIPAMTDMRRTPKEKAEDASPMLGASEYPYGLCISLCQDELDKLDMKSGDVKVGDMIHLHAMAKVTSVSSHETSDGKNDRIELQITHISSEDEADEDKAAERGMSGSQRRSKLYGAG